MKFGQLIGYNKRNIFRQNHAENEAGRLNPDLFLFYKKTLRTMVCSLISKYFDSHQAYIKNKLYKTLDYYWSRDMLNFDLSEKSQRIVSPPHFTYDFSRKMFPLLYSINWPNFMVCSPLLLEILRNMCIAIVCFPFCDVINFKINLILPSSCFSTWPKRSRQKSNYLENENSFYGEIKNVFHHS